MATKIFKLIVSIGIIASFNNAAIGACEEELQERYNSLVFRAERLPSYNLGLMTGIDDYLDLGGTLLTNEEVQFHRDASVEKLNEVLGELKTLRREHRCKKKDAILLYYSRNNCRLKMAKRNKKLRSLTAGLLATESQFKGYEHAMNVMANEDESMRTVLLNTLAGVKSFSDSKITEKMVEISKILEPCLEGSEE